MGRVSDAEDKQSSVMQMTELLFSLMTRFSWSISGRNVIQVLLRELRLWTVNMKIDIYLSGDAIQGSWLPIV